MVEFSLDYSWSVVLCSVFSEKRIDISVDYWSESLGMLSNDSCKNADRDTVWDCDFKYKIKNYYLKVAWL